MMSAVLANLRPTVGGLSDAILLVKGKMKKHEDAIKLLEAEKKDLELQLQVAATDAGGLDKGGGKKSEFSIGVQTVPQASSWDDFYAYMHKNKYYHLLQHRPSSTGCQELWERGVVIPGIEKFSQVKVTVKERK